MSGAEYSAACRNRGGQFRIRRAPIPERVPFRELADPSLIAVLELYLPFAFPFSPLAGVPPPVCGETVLILFFQVVADLVQVVAGPWSVAVEMLSVTDKKANASPSQFVPTKLISLQHINERLALPERWQHPMPVARRDLRHIFTSRSRYAFPDSRDRSVVFVRLSPCLGASRRAERRMGTDLCRSWCQQREQSTRPRATLQFAALRRIWAGTVTRIDFQDNTTSSGKGRRHENTV